MQFFAFKFTLLALLGSATSVSAMCPGFHYGVAHVRNLGNGVSRFLRLSPSTDTEITSRVDLCLPYGLQGWELWKQHHQRLRLPTCDIMHQCRNDGNRLVAPEIEGSKLDFFEEDFSAEDLSEEDFAKNFPEDLSEGDIAGIN
ncbi:hypothetical protein LA080_001317 [Diaporthe eres]|nr:hypothetical protein LA080_001317 [Diaporthe eres]